MPSTFPRPASAAFRPGASTGPEGIERLTMRRQEVQEYPPEPFEPPEPAAAEEAAIAVLRAIADDIWVSRSHRAAARKALKRFAPSPANATKARPAEDDEAD